MNYWLILLAIAIIAMVVGPVMMLQPSPAQRAEESLRTRAREMGLRVKIMSLPKQATDVDAPSATPMYYLPLLRPDPAAPEWLLLRTAYAHPAHFNQNWQWHGAGRASVAEQNLLPDLLQKFPSSVSAIEAGPQGFCCYWSERGGIETLDRLLPLLEALRNMKP